MTYDRWKDPTDWRDETSNHEEPTWVDDPSSGRRKLSYTEQSALKYKIIDFIQEHDPFGGRITTDDLLRLAAAMSRPDAL